MVSRSYQAMRRTRGPCVLLESTSSPSPLAVRNLLARSPRAVLVASGTGLVMATPEGSRPVSGDAFAALRSMLREVRPGRWPSEGGVAGVLAYDAARPGAGAPTPRLVALAVDRFLVEDADGVSAWTRAIELRPASPADPAPTEPESVPATPDAEPSGCATAPGGTVLGVLGAALLVRRRRRE